MSEQSLRAVLDRVASDKGFADIVRKEPIKALAEFDLSTVELFALNTADEDALRRLLDDSGDEPLSADLAVFDGAAMPAFHEEALEELRAIDAELAAGRTTTETSHTVTCCCW
jgi:hypothetical protein